jgi:3'-5' exoribonuclease
MGVREWVGKAPFPWPAVESLQGGAALVACFCVMSRQRDITKGGKPYYKLQLSDRNGAVEARVWDPVAGLMEQIGQGSFVGVRGIIEIYHEARQLKVSEIRPVEVAPEELGLFLPRSRRDPAEMEAELVALIGGVRDEGLRALLERILDPLSETGRLFRQAPAAKHNHHAYVGGLLEHTLSMAGACVRMAEHYAPAVDHDLVVAGALLHDLGKIREIGTQAGFPYTDEGKLLGHILLGLQIVADAAAGVPQLPESRLLLLQHLIASHQGRYEWQSPREPRILEGLILHYCDDLDAKMNQAMGLLAPVQDGWSAHDRGFGREFLRHLPAPAEPPAGGERVREAKRKVKFAGKLTHHPNGPAGARGSAPGASPGVRGKPDATERPSRPRAAASPPAPAPAPPPPPAPPEALPPRPITPAPDVLPPDPASLDLFT